MNTYTVSLQEEYGVTGGELECILMRMPFDGNPAWKRPAVIVVPGGGYAYASKREGAPIAAAFLARGYQTFVLTYLCANADVRYPEQLIELGCAVDYVKKHADEMNVNADEIFVVGFSAGGHLTANLAVDYQNVSRYAGKALDCKPTAVGLCYPVISKIDGHQGSYENLLNGYTDEAKEELLKVLNLDEVVTENTAPAFLWATANDACVPASNALRFALACARAKVPYEIHVYPDGPHGLSLADNEISTPVPAPRRCMRWVDDCAAFFRSYAKEPY